MRRIMVLVAMGGIATSRGQRAEDELQPLVETSARRLAIAEQIALAKWDQHTAVEDPPREAAVIAAAIRDGASRGLDPDYVASFFRAQIEASKLVQYSLLATWSRDGGPPDHGPVDLTTVIRPQLDHLQTELIDELAAAVPVRGSTVCHAVVARAIEQYLVANQHDDDGDSLYAVALGRALTALCGA
jgi:chorismate mutase